MSYRNQSAQGNTATSRTRRQQLVVHGFACMIPVFSSVGDSVLPRLISPSKQSALLQQSYVKGTWWSSMPTPRVCKAVRYKMSAQTSLSNCDCPPSNLDVAAGLSPSCNITATHACILTLIMRDGSLLSQPPRLDCLDSRRFFRKQTPDDIWDAN